MKLDQTYYIGSRPKQSMPTSPRDLDMVDIACIAVLFLSWVGLFSRYGIGVQAIVLVLFVAVVSVAGILDRKTSTIPNVFGYAAAILWVVSVWFMPYGLGPAHTALGAGGTVSFFAQLLGAGALPVLIDGVLGALIMLVICGLLFLIIGLVSGEESLTSGQVRLLAAVALFMGTTGTLLLSAMVAVFYMLFALLKRVLPGMNGDDTVSPMFYTGSYGQFSHNNAITMPLGLVVAVAVIVLLVFL